MQTLGVALCISCFHLGVVIKTPDTDRHNNTYIMTL